MSKNYVYDVHIHLSEIQNQNFLNQLLIKEEIFFIAATYDIDDYLYNKKQYGSYQKVRIALGYHPNSICNFQFDEILFKKYLTETKYVSEVGLDFSKEHIITKQIQIDIFDKIISMAKDKILIIHSRCSVKECIHILKKYNAKFVIFHWFTGNLKELNLIINSGFYISFNQRMLKSAEGKELLLNIPTNRILIESDAPFANKIVHNDYYKQISDNISNILHESQIDSILFMNFAQLLIDHKNYLSNI
ncbi:MAG: TatD family hydrolase [Candidatus Izemoplasmatales bacterium]|nr:TatD family hydrolase [Candidatus Izemoplasmatales bacterium]